MGQTILNRYCCAAEVPALADEGAVEACGDTEDLEQAEAGVTDTAEEAGEPLFDDGDSVPHEDTIPEGDKLPRSETEATEAGGMISNELNDSEAETVPDPVMDDAVKPPLIGMDGRTPDGAMPYELLKKQLEFLK